MPVTNIRARHGFSLIELLVVIAIIAILASVLFPVFVGAKRQANTSTCASNMKQIAIAMSQYALDHSGMLPRYGVVDPKTGAAATLSGDSNNPCYCTNNATVYDLQRYTKNQRIYKCPGAIYSNDYDLHLPAGTKTWHDEDYRWNNASISSTGTYMKSLDACTRPKRFMLVEDRHSDHHKATSSEPASSWVMLMVMADGHLESSVKPYGGAGSAWVDSKGALKYVHWDFPSCHPDADPLVAGEY